MVVFGCIESNAIIELIGFLKMSIRIVTVQLRRDNLARLLAGRAQPPRINRAREAEGQRRILARTIYGGTYGASHTGLGAAACCVTAMQRRPAP